MTAPAYDYVHLAASEYLANRPFTDIAWNEGDRSAMAYMAGRLRQSLEEGAELPTGLRPPRFDLTGPEGQPLRVILNPSVVIQLSGEHSVVGFFGRKRPNADRTPIDGVDVALFGEFPAYPEVLAYCSQELADGNFGNLVVMSEDAGRAHWRESTHHQFAVADLTPKYYASVRLHNGFLRQGAQGATDVRLVRTKYYDYDDGFWCGLRELD